VINLVETNTILKIIGLALGFLAIITAILITYIWKRKQEQRDEKIMDIRKELRERLEFSVNEKINKLKEEGVIIIDENKIKQ